MFTLTNLIHGIINGIEKVAKLKIVFIIFLNLILLPFVCLTLTGSLLDTVIPV